MELVEILAKELEVWPEGYTRIVQTMKELNLPIDDEDVRYLFNQWDYSDVSCRIYDAEFETSELADDYRTAIVTKEMWKAEKAKLDAQNTLVFDPIYCRDRIKEVDVLVESLEEERVSHVQALENEGFVLISTALVSPRVPSAVPVEDMSDWREWRKGDLLECVSHKNVWSREQEIGSTYSIICEPDSSYSGDDDLHILLETGYYVNPEDFKFHSRSQ